MSFVFDSFTDTNGTALDAHTGETGATWTKVVADTTGLGAWLNGGYCMENGGSHGHYEASGTPATAEYDVIVPWFVKTNLGNSGHLGRKQAGAVTFYGVFFSGTDIILYKCVAGTYTSLGTYTLNPVVGTTYVIKLQIRDAAKKIFIDGVERISSTDNVITGAGKVAIRLDNASYSTNTGVWAESITADDAITAVAKTFMASYNVIRQVVKTSGASYIVKAAIVKQLGSTYKARVIILKGVTPTYNVVVRVNKSFAPTYTIHAVPVNLTLPSISGTLQSGQLLTGNVGTWRSMTGGTFAEQWQVETGPGTGVYEDIAGETELTLQI